MSSDDAPSVILFFIDGIGLGKNDPQTNPFARYPNPFFSVHAGKPSFEMPGYLFETDAAMGVSGLPQSATGQTAIFTGYNAPQICGRHLSGFPSFSLRPYLLEKSILKLFKQNNLPSALINAYTESYLEKIAGRRGMRLMSATTLMNYGAKNEFFTVEDFLQQRSLYMDITGWVLQENEMIVSEQAIGAKEAGRRLVQISRSYKLSVFEYFLTDRVGHDKNMDMAKKILQHVTEFLDGIWEELNQDKELVIVTSDHGNFEDLSVHTHTKNMVGSFAYGKQAEWFSKNSFFLYDIARNILRLHNMEWDKNFVPSLSSDETASETNETNKK